MGKNIVLVYVQLLQFQEQMIQPKNQIKSLQNKNML
jgi:hypothetical protein